MAPDPWDSLVVPLGLAVALWVWQQGHHPEKSAAMRGAALLFAATASFASVASLETMTDAGPVRVGVSKNGEVVVESIRSGPATDITYAISPGRRVHLARPSAVLALR